VKHPLQWFEPQWGRQHNAADHVALLRQLAATKAAPVVLEAVGREGRVSHRIGVPAGVAVTVRRQLRAAAPQVTFERLSERPEISFDRATQVSLSTRRRPVRTEDIEAVSRSLLIALAAVGRDEVLLLRWVLSGSLAPSPVPTRATESPEAWPEALVTAPLRGPQPLDGDTRQALRAKRGEVGWRAIGQIAVAAAGRSRQKQLIRQVLAALRTAESPGVQVGLTNARTGSVRRTSAWRWPLSLNVLEVAALAAWPVGDTAGLPVTHLPHRRLQPNPAIPTSGRILGSVPGQPKRAIALSVDDGTRHLALVGPSGTGKSTLAGSLILQDLAAGRSAVLIEPKGDVVNDVIDRVEANRLGDVVVIAPGDSTPVGFNPLLSAGRAPELVADQLLAVFHGLYAAHWGPRTQDILHAALLTLARSPESTLCALPLLLTDASFRRRLVGRVDDPLGVGPFWASFERWSDAERTTAIAPVLNKVRPFLLRPQLRAILGQAAPRFDLRQVFTRGTLLLISTAKGSLGPEGSALFGSLITSALWMAITERTTVPAAQRRPVSVYLDEFQEYLHLPGDVADALTMARGMGVSLTVAHQHPHQLSPDLRAAIMANARSRVCFQLDADDAAVMAGRGSELDRVDFQQLPAFEAYARLLAGNSVQPWCSLATAPLPPALGSAERVRTHSRQAYGVPAADVDAAVRQLVGADAKPGRDDLAPRRRHGGTS
jgi:hypothetical protein